MPWASAHSLVQPDTPNLILCGERIKADKALQIGLVEEVVESGKGLETALELAQKVAKQSPDAIASSKTLIMSARYQPPSFNWIKERELFIKLFDGDNQQEGVNAFLEKRSPEWK